MKEEKAGQLSRLLSPGREPAQGLRMCRKKDLSPKQTGGEDKPKLSWFHGGGETGHARIMIEAGTGL